ncbi:hypothetical protein CHARACLAT_024378 [Characodon lateralis]|uniref:Uncharacterized protein n=1 Tax=Characodon lateralis TaxID=208331 RepID=A0ABU7EXD9_9TELE|nr:hypothetical protein [Characodon lateralis]
MGKGSHDCRFTTVIRNTKHTQAASVRFKKEASSQLLLIQCTCLIVTASMSTSIEAVLDRSIYLRISNMPIGKTIGETIIATPQSVKVYMANFKHFETHLHSTMRECVHLEIFGRVGNHLSSKFPSNVTPRSDWAMLREIGKPQELHLRFCGSQLVF